MKQLFGAVCAMLIAFSGPAAPEAGAQAHRDLANRAGSSVLASPGAPIASRAARRRALARRTYRPTRRAVRTYRQVWFGNKVVWWPVAGITPVARRTTSARRRTWHRATTRWANGRRVHWHPGYWTNGQASAPGTWTPEPVYRYNPNGQQPALMNAPAAQRTTGKKPTGAKTYPGYQYYYYGKPTSAAPGTPVTLKPGPTKPLTAAQRLAARRAAARRGKGTTTAAAKTPKDNIPTVYLYQNGHRQGIHLPAASGPAAAPAAPSGVAPGTGLPPGAPAVPAAPAPAPGGPLIPGLPGTAPAPGAPAPVLPAPASP